MSFILRQQCHVYWSVISFFPIGIPSQVFASLMPHRAQHQRPSYPLACLLSHRWVFQPRHVSSENVHAESAKPCFVKLIRAQLGANTSSTPICLCCCFSISLALKSLGTGSSRTPCEFRPTALKANLSHIAWQLLEISRRLFCTTRFWKRRIRYSK